MGDARGVQLLDEDLPIPELATTLHERVWTNPVAPPVTGLVPIAHRNREVA